LVEIPHLHCSACIHLVHPKCFNGPSFAHLTSVDFLRHSLIKHIDTIHHSQDQHKRTRFDRVTTTKTNIQEPHLLDLQNSLKMDLLNPYLLATLTIASTLLYLLLQPHPTTNLARWLQKKNYQYEVTFSLYMLTPTEKFVFSKRTLHQYLEERLADNNALQTRSCSSHSAYSQSPSCSISRRM